MGACNCDCYNDLMAELDEDDRYISRNSKSDKQDSPLIMPRLQYTELKDNHLSILEPIKGNVSIYFIGDKGDVEEKITLHEYIGDGLYMTLPKEWIGRKILVKYIWYDAGHKL